MTAITLSTKQNKLKEILTIGRYFRKNFGTQVYKIPVSIMGFTCPNIDGTVARGGCIYCENESFSPNISKEQKNFRLNPKIDINPYLDLQLLQLENQYTKTKHRLSKKFKSEKFIIYFQSFTNTYAPFLTLKALYDKALDLPDVVGISIGTRSDAVSIEILEYLRQKKDEGKEIWLEYGIQSIHDKTLDFINRGHNFENVKEWIKKTKSYDINVCAHIIFGLPNESEDMMLSSFRTICDLGVDSIKIHPLYITKNTKLAKLYKDKQFEPLREEEYLRTLVKAIDTMPNHIILQRITAGVSDSSLLAPKWCYDSHTQKNNAKNALLRAGFLY